MYGVCLLWGAQLVLWSRGDNAVCAYVATTPGCFTGGTVMQVLFALIMGAGALGQLAPSVTSLTSARSSAGRIFAVLDRVPTIDSGAAAAATAAATATAATTAATTTTAAAAAIPAQQLHVNHLCCVLQAREQYADLILVPPQHCGIGHGIRGLKVVVLLLQLANGLDGAAEFNLQRARLCVAARLHSGIVPLDGHQLRAQAQQALLLRHEERLVVRVAL